MLSVDVSINSKVILFKCWFSPTVLLWCRTSEWVGLCSLVYCTSYRTLSPSIISYLLCFTTESTQEAILLVFSKPFLLPLPPFIHQREFKIQQKWPSVCIADAADELSVFWGCELFFFIVVFVSRWCFQGCHECVDIKDQMLLEFWDLFAHVGQKKKEHQIFIFSHMLQRAAPSADEDHVLWSKGLGISWAHTLGLTSRTLKDQKFWPY